MDTRHDNLVHVSEALPAWVTPAHAGLLRSVCAQVRARCGTDGYIDRHRKELVWGYHNQGDVRPVYCWPLFRHYHGFTFNRFEMSTGLDISVDDICYAIQLAKVDPVRKQAWAKAQKERMESDQRSRMSSLVHESVRDASKTIDRRNRNVVAA